jgi:hypothetical protein
VLEESLIRLVRTGKKRPASLGSSTPSNTSSPPPTPTLGPVVDLTETGDPEKAEALQTVRPYSMVAPVVNGLAMLVIALLLGLGLSEYKLTMWLTPGSLLVRYNYDGDASRLALICSVFPPAALLASFPCVVLIGSLASLTIGQR